MDYIQSNGKDFFLFIVEWFDIIITYSILKKVNFMIM